MPSRSPSRSFHVRQRQRECGSTNRAEGLDHGSAESEEVVSTSSAPQRIAAPNACTVTPRSTLPASVNELSVFRSRTPTISLSMTSGALVHDLLLPRTCVRTTSPPSACRSLHLIDSEREDPIGTVVTQTGLASGRGTT